MHLVIMVVAILPKDKEILEIGICPETEQNVCLLERVISIKCHG
jgi:hypothetical protein